MHAVVVTAAAMCFFPIRRDVRVFVRVLVTIRREQKERERGMESGCCMRRHTKTQYKYLFR